MYLRTARLIVVCSLWTLLSTDLFAVTYYVRTDGNNSNSGTGTSTSQAWASVSSAVDKTLSPGDVVYVMPGTYGGTVTPEVDGNAAAPIQFIADTDGSIFGTAGAVILDAPEESDALTLNTDNYLEFYGFTIKGDNDESQSVDIDDCTGVKLSRCYIYNAGAEGVDVAGSSVDIVNCAIYDNSSDGIEVNTGSTVTVWNSTLGNNGVDGIQVNGGSITVYNSVSAFNSDDGFDLVSGGITVSNCISYGNSGFNTEGFSTSGIQEVDPMFVDQPSHNFRLLEGSPAIDAGITATGVVTNDIVGTARPIDGSWDIGCYEGFTESITGPVYLSVTGGATLDTLTVEDEDVLYYDPDSSPATRTFEGDNIYTSDDETDAAHILADGKILISVGGTSESIGALSFNDEDVVEYDPNTGTATLYFDGSTIFSADEDLDAVCLLSNGNLLISTNNSAAIGGLSFNDEDLVEYDSGTGTATLFFDGSAIFSADEDINGVHVDGNGYIYLSTDSDAQIGSTSFGDDDVVRYDPNTGDAQIYFNGGNLFSSTGEDIDAISLASASVTGLVGHWRLDETSGTLAADSSGNGFDGTYENGPILGGSGVHGYAAAFDGSNDVVRVADNASLSITNQLSISAWVKFDSVSGEQRLVSKGQSNGYYLILRNSSGKFLFRCRGLSGSEDVESNYTPVANKWIHVVGIYDGSSLRIYIDGQLDNQVSASGNISVASTDLTLGDRSSGGVELDGQLDEVRLYDYGLTDAEIAELYGLMAHWKLNETSGTTAVDSSGNSATGTVTGTTAWTDGIRSGAIDFTPDSHIEVNSLMNQPESFSVAGWANLDAADAGGAEIANVGNYFGLRLNSGTGLQQVVAFYRHTSSWNYVAFDRDAVGEGWHQYVATFDDVTDTFRLYMDGEQVATTSPTQSLSWTGQGSVSRIGAHTSDTSFHFDGKLDDVMVYNRAMFPEEIAEHYGLLGHWKLDETSGTVATDTSPFGNDGTYVGGVVINSAGPYPGEGAIAAQFDGSNDEVSLPNVDASFADGFATTFWFKPNSLPTTHYGFLQFSNGQDVDDIWIGMYPGTGIELYFSDTIDLATERWLDDNNEPEVGKWQHCAITVDHTGTATIYRNGEPIATGFVSLPGDVNRTQNSLADSVWLDNFDGSLYDVRVWNRPITPSEISEIYGLIGHWKMDEGSGSSTADSTGFENDVTLSGATWANTCSGVNCLQFDGTGDVATTDSEFDPPPVGSVAFWMRGNGPTTVRQRPFGVNGDWESRVETTGVLGLDLGVSPYVGDEPFSTTSQVTDSNRWYHVVATYDVADESFAVYVNGVIESEGFSPRDLLDQAAGTLTFGTRTGSTEYWAGAMRDFRVYNRKISLEEIGDLSGMIAHWQFNETTGSTAADSGVLGNNATYVSSPDLTVNGPYPTANSTAVDLDGTSESITAGQSLLNNLSEFTMMGWIRPDNTTPDKSFFGQHGIIELGIDSNSNQIDLWTSSGGSISGTVQLPFGKWSHITATGSGTQLKLYVNGREIASGGSTTSSYGTNNNAFKIGEGVLGFSGGYLQGRVDDVRVYGRSMCPDEVNATYKGGRPSGVRILNWIETR